MSNQNHSIKKDLNGSSLLVLETISLNDRKQVTQATNKSTGVTINAKVGEIILNAATLGTNTTAVFAVTNSKVNANSMIFTQVAGEEVGGPNGSLNVSVRNITNGSFNMRLTNTDDADVTTGKIIFLVLN